MFVYKNINKMRKIKDIGKCFKLLYVGNVNNMNGVGIAVDKELKNKFVWVNRVSDIVLVLR